MSLTPKVIDWSYYTGTVPAYGDCRAVVGEYACLLPDRHVESFLGIALLPGSNTPGGAQNVNHLRIPRNPGDGRMAGGGQDGAVKDQVLEWQWPAGWVPVGTMWGPNAVIYGPGDVVTPITSREQYRQTAGWRYISPAVGLVDCESTYADKPAGLYEWSRCGDVRIGQGAKPDMGCVVSFDGEPLRRLDPRPAGERTYPFNARFMHSDRRGDLFGICVVDLGARKTYFCWPTLAELRALPFVTDTPPPIEPPVEPPVNTPPDPAAVKAALKRERDKYPATVDSDQMVRILNDAGFDFPDMGLHRKDGHGEQPVTDIPCSRQILRYMPIADPLGWWSDVLGATGVGIASPQAPDWKRSTDGRESFVPCVNSGGGPVPPVGNTHRYQGGGNDTGVCDTGCGQPKVSDVHRVPEGKVPHVPWLGEDNTGDCDLCFQPVSAPIHGAAPPPSGDHEARLQSLEQWRAAVAQVSR